MGKLFTLLFFCLALSFTLHAQTGSYRSAQSGSWTDLNTWERWSGSAWLTPTVAQGTPTSLVTIQNGHTVTIPSNTTITIINGTGTDLTVSGRLEVSGTLGLSNGATTSTSSENTSFLSGSRYRHLFTNAEGAVPLAAWDINSTVEVAYITPNNTTIEFTSNGNWGQSFGNVEVNASITGSNRFINANGFLNNIAGNLIINATGNGTFRFNNTQTTNATIGGTFTVNGSSIFRLNETGTLDLTASEFTMNSGAVSFANGNNANTILNINGAFTVAGGTLTLANSNNARAILNLEGDFFFSGGSIDRSTNAAIPVFNFTGNPQDYTITNGSFITANNKPYSFVVHPSSTVNMNGTTTISGSVVVNGVLNMISTSSIAGTCSFTLSSDGTLGLGSTHASGALQAGNTTGSNLRNSGTRTFASGSTIMYNGTDLQFTGLGYPISQGVNLVINNASHVRPSSNLTVTGSLTLQLGNLDFSDRTVTLNGSFSSIAGGLFGNGNSVLIVSGAGPFGTLQFASGGNVLNTLTIERPNEVVSLGGNLTLTGFMNLNSGSFAAGANTITMQGQQWNTNGGTFLYETSTVRFDGNTTLTGDFPPEFYNIRLNDGATVTFPDGDVYIANDAVFMPRSQTTVFNHNNGNIVFNGTENQLLNGGDHSFYDLTLNKSGGFVTLTGKVNLLSVLDIQTGSQFLSNGNLVLVSSGDEPDVSALINTLPSGASVTGSVEVQRYMSGEGRIYRYLSSPVSNGTVAQWKDDFPITGTFSDPTPTQTICGLSIRSTSPSLFYYHEPTAAYVNYPSSGASTNAGLAVGLGYSAFIRRCDVATLVSVMGTVNQGTIKLPVSFANPTSAEDFDFSFNLVGNPYPAPIRWGEEGWNKNHIGAVATITDNGSSNGEVGFVYLDEEEGGIISQGQGFWVYAMKLHTEEDNEPVLLEVTEAAKSRTPDVFYREITSAKNRLTINLSNGSKTDKAYFRIKETALEGMDRNDAPKFENSYFNIATYATGNTPLAVNAVKEMPCERTLKLYVSNLVNGTYQMDFSREGIFEGYDVSVIDNYLGTTSRIDANAAYTFTVNADAASKAYDRFGLALNRSSINASLILDKETHGICTETGYSITIENAEPRVEYYATYNGQAVSEVVSTNEGGSLTLQLSTEGFTSGDNVVILTGNNACVTQALESVVIKKEALIDVTAQSSQICQGGSLTLSASSGAENASFVWYNGINDTEPVFQGAEFQTPVLSKTKTYYVAGVNSLGCEGNRVAVKAEVIPVTDVVITRGHAQTLQSSYAGGNQWYYNGMLIPNGNTQTIRPTKPGLYSVTVTVGLCSTTASIDYSHAFQQELAGNEKLHIFPNPVERHETVSIRIFAEDATDATVMNSLGKVIGKIDISKESAVSWFGSTDLDKLPAGIYYISVRTNHGSVKSKVIKQ